MIPDYIVIILGWVLLISTIIILIADIIVMCIVNKKLKVFNKIYKEHKELSISKETNL